LKGGAVENLSKAFRPGEACVSLKGGKPIAGILRPLSEYLRAFRAFDFDFIVDHGMNVPKS
jgi:hypothetical protein